MSDNPYVRQAILEAIQLAKEGRKAEARALIDELITDDPDNAPAWFVLAQLVEDRAHAIRCLRRVVELEPENARARAYLARLEGKAKVSGKKAGKPGASRGGSRSAVEGLAASLRGVQLPEPVRRFQWAIGLGAALLATCVLGYIALQLLTPAGSAGQADAIAGGSTGGDSVPLAGSTATATPTAAPAEPTPTPQPTPDAELLAMVDLIGTTAVNPVDLISLMERYLLVDEPLKRTLDAAPNYRVGSRDTFAVYGLFGLEEVDAALVYQNAVVNMWVDTNLNIPTAEVRQAADTFANTIYPAVTDVYGSEWTPGVDQDPRLNILTVWSLGPNVAGYYAFTDEYPQEVYPYSNQREMFTMSYWAAEVGSEQYMSTLAHEFQHMVQWHQDPNEDIWMNEGLSQVAERIAGYNAAFTHYNYLFDSRVQLNSWSADFRASYSNYGAGYLYLLYIWERLGNEIIRDIAQSPAAGLEAINAALAPHGLSADQMFGDWIVANYVNNPEIEDGRYGYRSENLMPICPRTRLAQAQTIPPVMTLPQYTANYIEIEGVGDFEINFRGGQEVGLISANAYSGKSFWWSNRADGSNMTLTKAFDLRNPSKATLQFWTWYEIDEGDAGIVSISTDGGQTWEFLTSPNMSQTQEDDIIAYSGASGGGSHGLWVNESIDLSPYVGKEALIRFEYITDIKVTGLGWAIDNIRIPELNYQYDVEQPEDGWMADGFLRAANRVPQNWAVSLVTYEGGTPHVQRLTLDAQGRTRAAVTLTEDVRRATLIVGAMAPATGVPASFHIDIGGTGVMDSLRNPPGVLLQDNFESPCSTFVSFILPDYSYLYQSGRYEMRVETEETAIWGPAQQEFSDIVLDVDTIQFEPARDSSTGVLCRVQDQFNFYGFEIRNDGTYRVFALVEGQLEALQDWTDSPAIQRGRDAQNHLQASCIDDELSFTVNGTLLGNYTDSRLRRGDIAFIAVTYEEGGLWVAFDNLVVRSAHR